MTYADRTLNDNTKDVTTITIQYHQNSHCHLPHPPHYVPLMNPSAGSHPLSIFTLQSHLLNALCGPLVLLGPDLNPTLLGGTFRRRAGKFAGLILTPMQPRQTVMYVAPGGCTSGFPPHGHMRPIPAAARALMVCTETRCWPGPLTGVRPSIAFLLRVRRMFSASLNGTVCSWRKATSRHA
jgi:hypothetical protein